MTTEFGRLKCKDLRDAWPDEAKDFTPWLAKNIDLLSEAIHIPLESEDTEVSVDQFKADILARNTNDPNDRSAVLIENQLNSSDHSHLGQSLTYLAGLDAQAVIWIARQFEEAHLSAVRWLNENTPVAFFAVQVKVIQIDDSPLAPLFVVQGKPNNWDRQIRAISLIESRRAFWTHYAECYPDDGICPDDVKDQKVNFDHYVESADLYIRQYVGYYSGNEFGIHLRGKRDEPKSEAFDRIRRYESAFQEEGIELGNEDYPASKSFPSNIADKANWDAAADWLHKYLHIYRRILGQSP